MERVSNADCLKIKAEQPLIGGSAFLLKGGGVMRKRHFIIWFAILVVTLTVLPASADDDEGCLLTLGTSLAAGETAIGPRGWPNPFACDNVETSSDFSYTDKLARYTGLDHEKLGCTGESILSFMGDLPSYCYGPGDSQFNQARNAIIEKEDLRLITIDLGANDLLWCLQQNIMPLEGCFDMQIDGVEEGLTGIITELQSAMDPAGDIPIIGMTYYNPLLVAVESPPLDAFKDLILEKFAEFNATLVDVYSSFDNVYVARVDKAFRSDKTPINISVICANTLMCTCYPESNIHPNNRGYRLISYAFINVILDKELLDDWDDDDDDDDDDD